MAGRPVTIRTLDLGADKTINGVQFSGPNPALGLRAIRFCLAEPQMFLTQLRAILRASHYGKVRLLVPMIAPAHEVDQVLHYVAVARETLAHGGIPFDAAVPIGGMIEVPGAALAVAGFMKKLAFLSIGTNDLIQYTLAIDRTDDNVAHLYDPLHPAVVFLVAHTIRAANKAGVPVAVCGEMAGEVELTRLLLGLGLRQFSMHPAQLLAVKQQVLRSSIPEVEALAQRILRSEDAERTRGLLGRLNA
jgi:phosphotransferase system enzyme I (PtsI)